MTEMRHIKAGIARIGRTTEQEEARDVWCNQIQWYNVSNSTCEFLQKTPYTRRLSFFFNVTKRLSLFINASLDLCKSCLPQNAMRRSGYDLRSSAIGTALPC